MQYALLIFQDEIELHAMPKSDQRQIMDEWLAFNADLEESDQLRGSTPLQLSSTAKTVSVRGGQVLTTDGPYAETKEQFGGLYLIEADSIEEAIKIGARMPAARDGYIEVRPVWDLSDFGQ